MLTSIEKSSSPSSDLYLIDSILLLPPIMVLSRTEILKKHQTERTEKLARKKSKKFRNEGGKS